MTTQEEHWRHRFLDAYRDHTGDARHHALTEAWFAFVSSDEYIPILTSMGGSVSTYYAYWTALVDAAHVEREPLISLDGPALVELKTMVLDILKNISPEQSLPLAEPGAEAIADEARRDGHWNYEQSPYRRISRDEFIAWCQEGSVRHAMTSAMAKTVLDDPQWREKTKDVEPTGYVGHVIPLTEPDQGQVFPSNTDFPFPRPEQEVPDQGPVVHSTFDDFFNKTIERMGAHLGIPSELLIKRFDPSALAHGVTSRSRIEAEEAEAIAEESIPETVTVRGVTPEQQAELTAPLICRACRHRWFQHSDWKGSCVAVGCDCRLTRGEDVFDEFLEGEREE